MNSKRLSFLLLLFAAALAGPAGTLSAYVDVQALHKKLTELHETLSMIETSDGPLCDPDTLARAQASLAQAWREYDEGDYWEAEDYLANAETTARTLLEELPGCRADRDLDGIPDFKDRCPAGPETYNGYLDADGCPDRQPSRALLTPERIELIEPIRFDEKTGEILPASEPVLRDVARILLENQDLSIRIEAHTDNRVSDEEARRITLQWATAVRRALLAHSVAPDRVAAYGMGSSRPIASNATPLGREMNRRVELIRVPPP